MNFFNYLFKSSRSIINILFTIFIGLTFYFTLTSSNLLLNSQTTTWVTMVMLLGLVGIIIIMITDNFVKRFAHSVYQSGWLGMSVLGILLLIWQIFFVVATHPAIGFDVNMLHRAWINPNQADVRGYFSQNYNNLPILLLQNWVLTKFHSTSWLIIDFVTLLLVDLSALINIVTMYLASKDKVKLLWYLQIIFLAFFPMIIIPYTDTWVLPSVSLILLGFVGMSNQNLNLIYRILFSVIAGVATAITYYIKPSGIIPAIAFVIIGIIYLCNKINKKRLLKAFCLLLFLLGSGAATFVLGQNIISNQEYISIDKSLEIPSIHFINMGMSGTTGAYNPHDALMMAKLPKKQDKIEYSKKMIRKRLKQRGFWGYISFLIKKQGYNTADGTFGWLGEGTFIFTKTPASTWKWWAQTFTYPNGKNVSVFRFISQLIWIFLIGVLLFGWKYHDLISDGLRLSLIGGFLFLLIFEGGRSRYLIQFLPSIMILVLILWQSSREIITKILLATGLKKMEVSQNA